MTGIARPWGRVVIVITIITIAATSSGCSTFSDQRLDQCSRLSQTLQMENAQLRDSDYQLRTSNADLARQAADSREKLRDQGRRIQALERSVLAYQSERDRMEQAFASIRREVAEETQTAFLPPEVAASP